MTHNTKTQMAAGPLPTGQSTTVDIKNKQYAVDQQGFVNFPDNRIPDILLSDLPPKIKYRRKHEFFTVEYMPGIHVGPCVSGNQLITPDRSRINYQVMAKIYRISMRAAKNRMDWLRDSSPIPTGFYVIPAFMYRTDVKTLHDIFSQARDLGEEIIGPVYEAHKILSSIVQRSVMTRRERDAISKQTANLARGQRQGNSPRRTRKP
jgi:hypothetical protein